MDEPTVSALCLMIENAEVAAFNPSTCKAAPPNAPTLLLLTAPTISRPLESMRTLSSNDVLLEVATSNVRA